jgi:hypothetical protein
MIAKLTCTLNTDGPMLGYSFDLHLQHRGDKEGRWSCTGDKLIVESGDYRWNEYGSLHAVLAQPRPPALWHWLFTSQATLDAELQASAYDMCFALDEVERYPLQVGDKGHGFVMPFGARLVPSGLFGWSCVSVY